MTPQLLRTHPAPEHEILDFPLPPPGTMGPPGEYVWLRENCPVARVGMPLMWPSEAMRPQVSIISLGISTIFARW